MATRVDDLRCSCDTGRPYDDCCGPYHRGGEAPDAESLMRSRYTAFARGLVDYLLRTMHPDHVDREEGDEAVLRSLRETLRRYRYGGLRVLDRRPPGSDGLAEVLFWARVTEGRHDRSFIERSYFAHDGVGWRYLAGDLLPIAQWKGATIADFERALEATKR